MVFFSDNCDDVQPPMEIYVFWQEYSEWGSCVWSVQGIIVHIVIVIYNVNSMKAGETNIS